MAGENRITRDRAREPSKRPVSIGVRLRSTPSDTRVSCANCSPACRSRVVAVNHDTSITMIERTYSRYIGDHTDALARKALLDIGSPPIGNVVPITAAR